MLGRSHAAHASSAAKSPLHPVVVAMDWKNESVLHTLQNIHVCYGVDEKAAIAWFLQSSTRGPTSFVDCSDD